MSEAQTTTAFTLSDQWFGSGPVHVTAFYSESAESWIVTKAVQNGWDITQMVADRVKFNAGFREMFVRKCEESSRG